MFILAIGTAVLFIRTVLMSVFSAIVVSNSVAISKHPRCGIFQTNGSMENPYYARMQKCYHDIEKKRVDNIPEDSITSVKVLMVVTSFPSSLSNLTLLLILAVLLQVSVDLLLRWTF
jgi:hypothetical protein